MECPACGAVLRKPRRGLLGWIAILAFWGFNIAMLLFYLEFTEVAEVSDAGNSVERAFEMVGVGFGYTALLVVWVGGAVILGIMALLTRPSR